MNLLSAKENLTLESTKSTRISFEAIHNGDSGLNPQRQRMLGRVPDTGDWAMFRLNTIGLIDLAYLTASTDHEFALLRGKRKDVLFHGTSAEFYRQFNENQLITLQSLSQDLSQDSGPEGFLSLCA